MRLGIDIGGTKTAVVAVRDDHSGSAQDGVAALRTAPSGHGPVGVVDVVRFLALEVAAAVGGLDHITTVGACMPGLVDIGSGVVHHAVNLGVEELALGRALEDVLGRAVAVENDVKAAAIGAARIVRPRPGERLAYLNLGTGLASAVVVDGQVVRGLHGVAGEIGHLPVGGDVVCSCGQVGCLETVASGSTMARMWPAGERLLPDPFASAKVGDGAAAAAVDVLCSGVGLAIQLLVLASGAERVVIGGGLAALGAPLHAGILADLERRASSARVVASLGLADRFELLPSAVPVAALGAAWLPDSPAWVGADHRGGAIAEVRDRKGADQVRVGMLDGSVDGSRDRTLAETLEGKAG
ncbi:sugar kinase [Intrasporangium oryzae NRRL B-24470]|uniref:Sugar kinase n=1 Tax=Intrasporangium oryzae NRRL B-24470 TaxID=1386089 RepID=W9GB66_9MICO|nr:ROK family protein [Intrasporangium oryzae]EWT02053.1 sugar kinase [Intrasporangium oryzae NRRL B-24470]